MLHFQLLLFTFIWLCIKQTRPFEKPVPLKHLWGRCIKKMTQKSQKHLHKT